jgi:hypothetical protein
MKVSTGKAIVTLTEGDYRLVENLVAEGWPFEQILTKLGITRPAFYQRRRDDPRLNEAIEAGRRRQVPDSRKLILKGDDLTRIEELTAKGFGLRAVAKRLGVGLETLRTRRQDDPEVEAALISGREMAEKTLVDSLMARALDPKNPQGAASAMFLLKTRHGYREHAELDTGNRVAVQVVLPAALEPDQYQRLIEVHPKALEGGTNEE